jgi:hypothetical protein
MKSIYEVRILRKITELSELSIDNILQYVGFFDELKYLRYVSKYFNKTISTKHITGFVIKSCNNLEHISRLIRQLRYIKEGKYVFESELRRSYNLYLYYKPVSIKVVRNII